MTHAASMATGAEPFTDKSEPFTAKIEPVTETGLAPRVQQVADLIAEARARRLRTTWDDAS